MTSDISDIMWIHVTSQRFLSFVPKLQLRPGCSSPQGQHPALYRLAEILYPLNEMIHEELVHWIGGMVQARFDDLSFRIVQYFATLRFWGVKCSTMMTWRWYGTYDISTWALHAVSLSFQGLKRLKLLQKLIILSWHNETGRIGCL